MCFKPMMNVIGTSCFVKGPKRAGSLIERGPPSHLAWPMRAELSQLFCASFRRHLVHVLVSQQTGQALWYDNPLTTQPWDTVPGIIFERGRQ
jgi:hypothetical protein